MVSHRMVPGVVPVIVAGLVAGCGASGSTGLGSGFGSTDGGAEDAASITTPNLPTAEAGPGYCGDTVCESNESGDNLKLNGQQTISKSEFLDLTNGRVWNVRESGGSLFSKWDWELQIESWGCAAGAPPAK